MQTLRTISKSQSFFTLLHDSIVNIDFFLQYFFFMFGVLTKGNMKDFPEKLFSLSYRIVFKKLLFD